MKASDAAKWPPVPGATRCGVAPDAVGWSRWPGSGRRASTGRSADRPAGWSGARPAGSVNDSTGQLSPDSAGPQAGSGAAATAPGLVNVANMLTVLRLALVPLFVACLLAGGTVWRLIAFALFWAASLTDMLDGKLARRRGLVTDFGKLADPIADKVLIGAALVSLSVLGHLPWWITGLIVLREVGVTVMRLAVVRRAVIAASRGGKVKTLLQVVAISLYVLPGPFGVIRILVMAAALAATLLTGADYVVRVARLLRARPVRA